MRGTVTVSRICANCDEAFEVAQSRGWEQLCSACRSGTVVPDQPKTCEECGKTFRAGHSHGARYCSATCRVRVHRRRQATIRECLNCGEPFAILREPSNKRFCSVLCRQPLMVVRYENCAACGRLFTIKGDKNKKTCSDNCSAKYRNARIRLREHLRRTDICDVTPEDELTMRRKARKCPLCGVRLTDKPNLPNSKHLDHILPLNQGGTHTWGNLRILCATCNLSRPKDGRDFYGQLTLWAQGPSPVSRLHGLTLRAASRETCGKGLHPWIPANIKIDGKGKKICKLCRQASGLRRNGTALHQCKCGALFAAPGRTFMCPDCTEITARKAAELHASGLTWDRVAAEVGYQSGTGAMDAARRIGYVPVPRPVVPKPAGRLPCSRCGVLIPDARGQRIPACRPCRDVTAREAAEMYGRGMTLEEIGDRIGYSSKTSVSNLIKSVADVEIRRGRPSIIDRAISMHR